MSSELKRAMLKITEGGVHRFLKQVCHRQNCPSCSTEFLPMVMRLDWAEVRSEPGSDNARVELDVLRLYRLSDDHASMTVKPLFLICPNCGRVEVFAEERIRYWLAEEQDG